MDQFVIPVIEDVTPPNLTPNTSANPTLTTPNSSQNTIPNDTPNTTPIELKSPKKEGDDEPLTNKKKPIRVSDIWDHFTKIPGGDPLNPRCTCNYCAADYACHSTRVGTSSLWAHFKKCKKNPERVVDKKQKLLSFKKEAAGGSSLLAVTFNKVRCRNALAKFIVKDEQAFKVVEGDGFKELLQELQPMFDVPSRVTVARDVHHLYYRERTKLMEWLNSTSQRVCLTTDCWTSRTQLSYMCLTAHYIDSDWKLQKKIINFCQISNHKGDTIGKAIETCLLGWGIEKVFTVTLDNASANKEAVGFVRRRVNAWRGGILDGEHMHLNTNMKGKYDKYWGNAENINPLLFLAVVLDPRYKMGYLKYCFENVYATECVARVVLKVESLLQRLYAIYDSKGDADGSKVDNNLPPSNASNVANKRRLLQNYMHQQQLGITEKKNDIDRYLNEEPLNPMTSSFDILLWWKDNSEKYKVLSMIARDVLAIPVSTVASESAFSTSGRILDPFRSSLSPKMVEALVCTQSWLKGNEGGLKLDGHLDETHSYELLEEEQVNKVKEKDHATASAEMHIIDV